MKMKMRVKLLPALLLSAVICMQPDFVRAVEKTDPAASGDKADDLNQVTATKIENLLELQKLQEAHRQTGKIDDGLMILVPPKLALELVRLGYQPEPRPFWSMYLRGVRKNMLFYGCVGAALGLHQGGVGNVLQQGIAGALLGGTYSVLLKPVVAGIDGILAVVHLPQNAFFHVYDGVRFAYRAYLKSGKKAKTVEDAGRG